MRPFTPDDAPIFFGRGNEIDELVQLLKDPAKRLIIVAGASGSGKSSLVAAGLIPSLRNHNAVVGSKDWLLPWVQSAGEVERRTWTGLRFTPGELGAPGEFGGDPFLSLAAKLAPTSTIAPSRCMPRSRIAFGNMAPFFRWPFRVLVRCTR
ncbi:MAG: ATP-binding protein [Burkholderiales bacterium]